MTRVRSWSVVGALVFAACSTPAAEVTSTTTGAVAPSSTVADTEPTSTIAPLDVTVDADPVVIDIPGAVSVNVASDGADAVVAWVGTDTVSLAALDPVRGQLGEPVAVEGDNPPFAHPIERPALGLDSRGIVHLAYTSWAGTDGSVVYRTWDGAEVGGPGVISGEPRPETVLVHLFLDGDQPVFSWLEDATLSVATTVDGAVVESEEVDDLTCDCCNPVPMRVGDSLAFAYRDQIRDGGDVIRDVQLVRTDDGGATFSEPVLVADDHWYIDACPFSGPSTVAWDDTLVIAWMDARQSVHPDQRTTSIWVDRSTDGARTFGTDLRLTDGGIHRWPILSRGGDGVIHVVWETQGENGGISYTRSEDDGLTFAPHQLLIPSGEAGSATAPSLVVHGDRLLVTWRDPDGGHVAIYDLAG